MITFTNYDQWNKHCQSEKFDGPYFVTNTRCEQYTHKTMGTVAVWNYEQQKGFVFEDYASQSPTGE